MKVFDLHFLQLWKVSTLISSLVRYFLSFCYYFFDILSYFGILTWIIDKVGAVISKISRLPKLESFFSIQMMFLGNTEALAVVRDQLSVLKENRLLTFGIMSMSSVSGSILGAYLSMVPATYIFSAIPLNCINALILANVLNPVEVSKEEDVVYTPSKHEKGFLFYYFKQYVSWDEYGYRYFSYGNWLCSFNSMFKWDFRIFVTGLTIQKSSPLSLVLLHFTRFIRQ